MTGPGLSGAAQPLGSCRSHQAAWGPVPCPTTHRWCAHCGVSLLPHPHRGGCLRSNCLGIASESFGSLGSRSWEGGTGREPPLSISQTNQHGCTSLPKAFPAPCPSQPRHSPIPPSARSGTKPHACRHPKGSPLSPASPPPVGRSIPVPRGAPSFPEGTDPSSAALCGTSRWMRLSRAFSPRCRRAPGPRALSGGCRRAAPRQTPGRKRSKAARRRHLPPRLGVWAAGTAASPQRCGGRAGCGPGVPQPPVIPPGAAGSGCRRVGGNLPRPCQHGGSEHRCV